MRLCRAVFRQRFGPSLHKLSHKGTAMNDLDAKIAETYNLTGPEAEEWVDDDDNEKAGESRYALLRTISSTAAIPGGLIGDQLDEKDPMGSHSSICAILKYRNVPFEQNNELRARFMTSSRTFDPQLFLQVVHQDATYDNLVAARAYLQKHIVQMSGSLKNLVEGDYSRYVTCKSLLDSVLEALKPSGSGGSASEIDSENGSGAAGNGATQLRAIVDDMQAKLALIMKPINENLTKQKSIASTVNFIESHRELFALPVRLRTHILANNHAAIVRDYRAARCTCGDFANQDNMSNPIYQRIWAQVQALTDDYRKGLWLQLDTTDADSDYLRVISKILEIGSEDNPILKWIDSQFISYTHKVDDMFDRLKIRLRMICGGLSRVPPPVMDRFLYPLSQFALYQDNALSGANGAGTNVVTTKRNVQRLSALELSNPAANGGLVDNQMAACDAVEVIEMWMHVREVIDEYSKLTIKACKFWDCCREFLQEIPQRGLPTGFNHESKTHLSFSQSQVEEINERGRVMMDKFIDCASSFFSQDFPLSSQANSLSSVKYLTEFLITLTESFDRWDRVRIYSNATEKLFPILSNTREAMVNSICTSWLRDAKELYLLEDWTIVDGSSTGNSRTCYTKICTLIAKFQKGTLAGIVEMIAPTGNDSILSKALGQASTRYQRTVLQQLIESDFIIVNGIRDAVRDETTQSTKGSISSVTTRDDLTPEEWTHDEKLLLTLSNIDELQNNVFPSLNKYFERTVGSSTKEMALKLREKTKSVREYLLEKFLRNKKAMLSEIIRTGIGSGKWTISFEPVEVSNYVYQVLHLLVELHATVAPTSRSLLESVISTLYVHIAKNMLSNLRETERFSKSGALQVLLDVYFMQTVLAKYAQRDGNPAAIFDNIWDTVKQNSTERSALSNHPEQQVREAARSAKAKNLFTFRCFMADDDENGADTDIFS